MKLKNKIIAIMLITVVAGIGIIIAVNNTNNKEITLATTTSTYDSGLLDYLLPEFTKDTGINVKVLSVGTGQALELGRRGDADVILVHARASEDEFVQEGYGVHRACIMYNDFVLVGPDTDPANITSQSIVEAFIRIRNAGELGKCSFFSRGDNSGTNKKEISLWNATGSIPNATSLTWYKETGQGMGNTLTISNDNSGYTLVDRGTWLSMKDALDLQILNQGDKLLLNPYGAILINQTLHPSVQYDLAHDFVAYLTSQKGQSLIANFTKNSEQLFHPAFGICDVTHDCPTRLEEVTYWMNYNGNYTG